MGCGACSNSQISDSHRSLQQRLLLKIAILRDNNRIADLKQFVSIDELRMIENATSLHQTLHLEDLHRLQAGEQCLLSKERRIAWKLAIYEYVKMDEYHPFSECPTTNNQKTKNRFQEISLDINRTFPSITQLNKQQLSNVLQNITLCYQGIGYTQGMNFYIGFLLLCGFTPEQAYQIFIRLSHRKEFLLIRNFCENFKNVICCVNVMEIIMKENKDSVFNTIIAKIQAFGMNLFLFVFSWFLSYFLYNFNLSANLLIWDYLLLFSVPIANTSEVQAPPTGQNINLFGCGFVNSINFALKILQSLSDKLIQCTQAGEIMAILRHDAIQNHLDQLKTEELIAKCRSEPLLDWNTFKSKCQQSDSQLSNIINDLELEQASSIPKGHFISFLNECKHPKRTQFASHDFQ